MAKLIIINASSIIIKLKVIFASTFDKNNYISKIFNKVKLFVA